MIGAFIEWEIEKPQYRNGKPVPGYVIDGNGCHIWVGASIKGYGQVRSGGVTRLVHRVRYEREIGPIPPGMHLDHYVCNNGPRGCCNPRHCRPVSPRENILRGNSPVANQLARTHCPRGHPLSGDNLVPHQLEKHGKRSCLICARVWGRKGMDEFIEELELAKLSVAGCRV